MILFKKIRWKNLLSTGNIFTELDLNTHNTTLIVGENGAGKSTLLDALSFVLFGKPFRKINKPQLLNTITNKQLVVEVEFSIGPNEFKIIRGMKPNIFEVYKNGTLMNQAADNRDYQDVLEKQIIRVNHKSFCQVVVLGSATFQPFMQLPAHQRREIIEDLLDLQIFTVMNSLLKDKILTNSESLIRYTTEKKSVEEKIVLVKEHLKQLQNNNVKMIEEKKSRIAESNEQIDNLKKQYDELTEQIKNAQESIKDEPTVSKKINTLGQLKHKIEANLSILNKEVGFFHQYDNCPTCKQQIDEKFKTEAIDTKQKEIVEITEGLDKLAEEYDKTNARLNEVIEIHSNINTTRIQIETVKTKIQSLMSYCSSLESEIQNITNTMIEEDDDKISDLETQLKNIETNYYDLQDEKNVLSVASTLLKDGGIKARIIKQYIPVINKLINKYLSTMEFLCQFELDEEFNETIKSRFRDIFSYASFSEGEKMRINLAILFTWRAIAKLRNSINTNILIMDEVFDSSLDSNGTDEFLKLLNNLTKDTNTFIISHKSDQLYDKFERVIKFKKIKNFSAIETS
jgi:DNA repair exonuclease SbcCD ATPase subunit